jgi:hypothetical protein
MCASYRREACWHGVEAASHGRSWITDTITNLTEPNGSGGAGEPGSRITARRVPVQPPHCDDRTKPAGARTTFKFE